MAARVINAIASNPKLWAESAIVITYDESDGLYDHVPPRILSYGPDGLPLARGVRIPLLLISPFARAGAVSHAEGDHNAVIETINAIFGLQALSSLPEEKAALAAGNSTMFNQYGPAGFEQKYLGPRDTNSPITDSLLSGFSPKRLEGRAAAAGLLRDDPERDALRPSPLRRQGLQRDRRDACLAERQRRRRPELQHAAVDAGLQLTSEAGQGSPSRFVRPTGISGPASKGGGPFPLTSYLEGICRNALLGGSPLHRGLLTAASALAGPILDRIRADGVVRCGGVERPGLIAVEDSGKAAGLDSTYAARSLPCPRANGRLEFRSTIPRRRSPKPAPAKTTSLSSPAGR